MPRGTFPACWCQCCHPCGEPLLTHTSTGSLPTLPGSFSSVSSRVIALFLWVLVCTRFCLCPPRVESLHPPVLWKFYNQILLHFKSRFPGNSQSLCRIPRLRSLMWGWEPSQQWENFFGIIILQFVDHPLGGYGIWFYHDHTPPIVLLKLLLCLWTWGILFWWVTASSLQWLFNS